MPNEELQNEFKDVGRGVDKPKGLVKLALIGMASAIVGLATFITVLIRENIRLSTQCALEQKQLLTSTQKTIDDIRVEYNKKLEERIAKLENIEQRVDSLPKKK